MRIRKVPSNLQIKVIKWFDYLWLSQKSTDEERSISCLPGRNMCRLNMPKHFWCIYNRKDAKVPNFGVKVESMCVLESSYERLQQQQQDSFIIWCTQNYSNTFTCVLQFRHQYTSIYTIYWDSCLQRDSLTRRQEEYSDYWWTLLSKLKNSILYKQF